MKLNPVKLNSDLPIISKGVEALCLLASLVKLSQAGH